MANRASVATQDKSQMELVTEASTTGEKRNRDMTDSSVATSSEICPVPSGSRNSPVNKRSRVTEKGSVAGVNTHLLREPTSTPLAVGKELSQQPQSSQPLIISQPQQHPGASSEAAAALELSRQTASKRDQNWDSQFEALLAYSSKYNHCNVRPGYTVDIDGKVGVNLYAWLALQRRHKKHNKLRPDRLVKLQLLVDASKLSWSAADSGGKADDDDEYVHVLPPPPPPSWGCHYDALLIYMEAHGTANVPSGHVVEMDGRTKIDLGSWLEDQRKAKIRNTLWSLHLRRLDNLAREGKLAWHTPDPAAPPPSPIPQSVLDEQWQEKFEATRAYVALHPEGCLGDDIDVRLRIEVPEGQQPSLPFDLFQWVRGQRMGHFYNTIKPYRSRLLQVLVDQNLFCWMSKEEALSREEKQKEKNREEAILWTAWYNALVWLANNRGECNLNSHGTITLPDGSEAELGKWLHIQKKYIKKGTLDIDRCSKLLQLINENKLDRVYWVKYFLFSYPSSTFSSSFPDLFPESQPQPEAQLSSYMSEPNLLHEKSVINSNDNNESVLTGQHRHSPPAEQAVAAVDMTGQQPPHEQSQ